MIYTASFYAQGDWQGAAYRVSRGYPRGKKPQWDNLPFLYPSRALLIAYRAGDLDFDGLAKGYVEELERGFRESADFQGWMESAAALGDFTLLCFEKAGEPCHRRVLARWLAENVPLLTLGELR